MSFKRLKYVLHVECEDFLQNYVD